MPLSQTLTQRLKYAGMSFFGDAPSTDELFDECLKHGNKYLMTVTQCKDGGWLAILASCEGEGETYQEALARLLLNLKDGVVAMGTARPRIKKR